jgi:hypothetical protein
MAPLKNITIQENLGIEIFAELVQYITLAMIIKSSNLRDTETD